MTSRLLFRLVCLTLLPVFWPAAHAVDAAAPPVSFDLQRPEIRAWVAAASERLDIPTDEIDLLLANAVPQASILELMARPAEQVLPWWQYRARFLSPARVDAGLRFWEQHRELLDEIAVQRGVPPEYLLAIIGVETSYGRVKGRYRVLDALTTLAFDYPPRAKFFRGELEQFVLMAHAGSLDPLAATGSYAGAMGAPQFIPSSYRRFAVDAGGDGLADLWNDWRDILASIANYFVEHGWKDGEPVLAEAGGSNPSDDPLARSTELKETIASLTARGYEILTPVPATTPVMLLAAERENGLAWRVGFHNFRVITRYNRSPRYAMAVHDLAQTLAARVRAPDSPPISQATTE